MHPDIRHDIRAVGAAALRDFVLVMREDEVDAAAMDVEGFAEQGFSPSPSIQGASRGVRAH